MDVTVGATILSAALLSCSTIVVGGLFWITARTVGLRPVPAELLERQEQMHREVTALADDIREVRKLLEDVAE